MNVRQLQEHVGTYITFQGPDNTGNLMVRLKHVELKGYSLSNKSVPWVCGRGSDVKSAVEDYLQQIAGKTIVLDVPDQSCGSCGWIDCDCKSGYTRTIKIPKDLVFEDTDLLSDIEYKKEIVRSIDYC